MEIFIRGGTLLARIRIAEIVKTMSLIMYCYNESMSYFGAPPEFAQLNNASGGGHLIFDGQILSFPQHGSKRRKLQIHVSQIDAVVIRKGRGLKGELNVTFDGKTEWFHFPRRENSRAERLVRELLKASADPGSYTLPEELGGITEHQPSSPITRQEVTQTVEKNEGGSGGNLNRLESLKMLGELKESGVLTEEEFLVEKKKLLDVEEAVEGIEDFDAAEEDNPQMEAVRNVYSQLSDGNLFDVVYVDGPSSFRKLLKLRKAMDQLLIEVDLPLERLTPKGQYLTEQMVNLTTERIHLGEISVDDFVKESEGIGKELPFTLVEAIPYNSADRFKSVLDKFGAVAKIRSSNENNSD